ncbi:MAG: hypothetical protein LBH80_03630 [Prevotellaceae bacterium]|jgi:hypothetical protein|nr:hypothetical protein [Prevotellaceae bacterium]
MKKLLWRTAPVLFTGLFIGLFTGCSRSENLSESSEYITQVFEYVYAPGQHSALAKKQDAVHFTGAPSDDVLLGGFGGYIIGGFDHDVPNVDGEYDFEVFSSGFSPEPAIVYVMADENGNGLPDDEWYELRGNLFGREQTIRDYRLTYYKPVGAANIRWADNWGNSGELKAGYAAGKAETQPTANWWWSETEGNEITFTGTRLPDAYVNRSDDPSKENWEVPQGLFLWGYAENNHGEDYVFHQELKKHGNQLDISNAVDRAGNPVKLSAIRFIKVQTAVFQQAGWLNEVSSEVQGARDLHFEK